MNASRGLTINIVSEHGEILGTLSAPLQPTQHRNIQIGQIYQTKDGRQVLVTGHQKNGNNITLLLENVKSGRTGAASPTLLYPLGA